MKAFTRILVLIFLVAGIGLAAEPVCPIYERLQQTYKGDLPEHIELPKGDLKIREDVTNRYFSLAYRFWKDRVDFERLDTILLKLSENQPIDPQDAKFLKFSRKIFDLVRQGFVIFDEGGKPPQKFKEFTQEFGTLNDLVANGQPAEAAAIAGRLRKKLPTIKAKDYDQTFVAGIPTINLFSVATHVRRSLEEKGDFMLADELHEVRKSMKRFMNYYRLAYAATPTERNKSTFEYLRKLNEDLGEINDDAVSRSLEGGLTYDARKVRLPRELRGRILEFLQRIDWRG